MNADAAAPATPAPAAALPPLETVDGASLVATLPAVSERAVAALEQSTPPAAPVGASTPTTPAARVAVRSPRTKAVFDPAIHRANPDGTPFRNARGALMPKAGPRGPRKPSNAAASPAPAASTPTPPTPAVTGSTVPSTFPGDKPATPPAAAPAPEIITEPAALEIVDATAEAYLRGGYMVADKLVGGGKGEWQPDDAAEHEAFKAATVAWLRTRKSAPPSPFGAWLAALAAFVLSRVERVNTSKRLRRWFPWFYDDEPEPERKPGNPAKTENGAPVRGEVPPPTPEPAKFNPDPTSKFFGA